MRTTVEIIKEFKSAILIKKGDLRVKLGYNSDVPKIDCRVIAEDIYQEVINLLEQESKENEECYNYKDWETKHG